MTSDVRVERVDVVRAQAERAAWNGFVQRQPGAQLGHAAEWAGIFERAYGVEVAMLAARDERGALRGVLPLARFRGLTGRRELVSLPYLDAAGVLAEDDAAADALMRAAFELAGSWGASAVELRAVSLEAEADAGGDADEAAPRRVDLRLVLEADEDAQWSAVGAKVRNQTRKATKSGLELGAATGADALDDFYAPFCRNMRDLGSPVHGRALFAEVVGAFGDAARVITCHGGGPSVGGLLAIDFGGTVSVPWASTLREERARCPNNLIYWEALRWAIERGARVFDFGRSPVGEGTYRFKKGWGATEVPLRWSRFDAGGAPLPVEAIGDDPTMRRLSAVWARLPVGLTRRVGPPIRRRLSA